MSVPDYAMFPFYGYDVNASGGNVRGRPVPGQPGLNVVDTSLGPGYQPDPNGSYSDSNLYFGADPSGNISALTNPADISARRADARTRGQQAIAKQIAMGLGSAYLANTPWSTGATTGVGGAAPEVGAGSLGTDAASVVPEIDTVGGASAGVPTAQLTDTAGVSAPSAGGSSWFSKIANMMGNSGGGGSAPGNSTNDQIAQLLDENRTRVQIPGVRRRLSDPYGA